MREQVLAALRSVIAKSAYPADVIAAFSRLGDDQRGEPESAMLKIQRLGGGVFSYVVEHCGDITHRMSHMAEYGRLGREYVVDKATKVLETLESPYGFVKEMGENTRNNVPHTSPPLDEATYKTKLKELSLDYANKHSRLVVYNKPQWLAREAAVALGKWEFNRAEKYLKDLLKIANNANEYEEQASSVVRDSNGNIKPYSATSVTSSVDYKSLWHIEVGKDGTGTYTPNFSKWPKVAYHATSDKFTEEFQRGFQAQGLYLAFDLEVAKHYSKAFHHDWGVIFKVDLTKLKLSNESVFFDEQGLYDAFAYVGPVPKGAMKVVAQAATASKKVTVYRGETRSSENRGKGGIGYWSFDPEFAVQFTQTGQMHEVMKRQIDLAKIYDATKEGKKLPSANSESDFDAALTIAEEKGYCGVRFSEGKDYSDSVYIFDKSIFGR